MIAKLVSRKLVRQVGQSSIAPSILAGLAFFVGTNDILAQQTPATAGIAPPYKSLRYDENYSYHRIPRSEVIFGIRHLERDDERRCLYGDSHSHRGYGGTAWPLLGEPVFC